MAAAGELELAEQYGGFSRDTIRRALEYWIPAEDLDALNASIVGTIEVIAEFR